jgi:hypothetical protein
MMKELGPAAREFLESHRNDGLLTDAARARIKQKLMLRVSAVGATTAVAGTAAGMSLASKAVLVALAVTGAVGAGSLSVWALRSRAPWHMAATERSTGTAGDVVARTPATMAPSRAPEPAAPAVTPPAPIAMSARAAAAPARPRAPRPGAPPRAGVALARDPVATTLPATAPGAAASAAPVDSGRRDQANKIDDPVISAPQNPTPAAARLEAPDPEPELRALREAREDLRAGRPASAYRRLEDFDRQHPGGMLAQERSALAAIALCQARPGREAQARAAEFLRRSPESPLAPRVKSACEPGRDHSW